MAGDTKRETNRQLNFVICKKKKYKTTEMGGVGGGVIGEIFVKNFKQEGEIRKKISNFFSR